jgi:hypothetical protein
MSKASSHGAIVFDYLQKKYPEPRTALQIAAATGLSYAKVMTGIRHIKEVLGPIHGEPIVYQPRYHVVKGGLWVRHTYKLAESAVEVKEYGAWRLGIHAKQLRNAGLVLQAGVDKFGDADLAVLLHSVKQAADTAEFVQKKLLGAP